MKITVFEDKIRAEIMAPGRQRQSGNQLTKGECQVLVEKLRGGTMAQISSRIGRSCHAVAQAVGRMRDVLLVDGDVELGYLAYERGWVVFEEEGERDKSLVPRGTM